MYTGIRRQMRCANNARRNDSNTLLCKQSTKVRKFCFTRQAQTAQIEQSTHKICSKLSYFNFFPDLLTYYSKIELLSHFLDHELRINRERCSVAKWRRYGSFLLIPPPIVTKILTPPPTPPLTQKRTRLWMAKIHSHLSWNIALLIISHIHYGVCVCVCV